MRRCGACDVFGGSVSAAVQPNLPPYSPVSGPSEDTTLAKHHDNVSRRNVFIRDVSRKGVYFDEALKTVVIITSYRHGLAASKTGIA